MSPISRRTFGLFSGLLAVCAPAAPAVLAGCVYDTTGSRNLSETEVDAFGANHSGDTLEQQLQKRAEWLGLELAWHDSVSPDQNDAKSSITGRRLVRWAYNADAGETETRFYRFEVYRGADRSDPLDEAEVSLATVLQEGWTVVVVEVQNPLTS